MTKKSKIALFGGSGQTGQEFLDLALAEGHPVKVLARTPSKITQSSDQLEIIKGDVLNPEAVQQTIEGTDVVVSLFGQVKGSPADLQTKGTQYIVDAMEKEGIKRLVSLSGGGLPYEKDEPKFADKLIKFIMRLIVPKVLKDAEGHAEVLRKSDLNWTVIRGPRLTNEERRGEYRVGWVGVNASTKIGRADLADFIFKETFEKKYLQQMPFVSY